MNPDSILMDLIVELRAKDIGQRQEIERLKSLLKQAEEKPSGEHVDDLRPNPTMEY
jgi:hypothetical protein